jgi:putative transposase
MSTYTQTYYHIIFSTKNREPVLKIEKREDLSRFIWGIIKNKHCHLYRINGVADHVHLLTSLHPTVNLAGFVKDIKLASSQWIKDNRVFPNFSYWQDGYGAFTHSHAETDRVVEYIKTQAEHHKKVSFHDELRKLLAEAGVEFDERYLL